MDDNSNVPSQQQPPSTDEIEAEFDPRLSDVWLAVFHADLSEQKLRANLGSFMRMAYLRGYEDALTEPVPGTLHKNLGLRPPVRESAQPAAKPSRRSVKGGHR